MQKSIECTGLWQHNGESLVYMFIHWLQLLLWMCSTNHNTLLDGIRKNSFMLITTQCINSRLSPLCF